MSPAKHPATRRIGGPGASHENRKQPKKSKPHGQLNTVSTRSGNRQRRKRDMLLPKGGG